jgi:hypothetical protein
VRRAFVGPRGLVFLHDSRKDQPGVNVAVRFEKVEHSPNNPEAFRLGLEVGRLGDLLDQGSKRIPVDLVAKDSVLFEEVHDVVDLGIPVDRGLLCTSEDAHRTTTRPYEAPSAWSSPPDT